MNETNFPRVGVGVLVIRNGHLLLGERKGAHGAGTFAPPGGHLEFGETVENCAKREVLEETGLFLDNFVPGPFVNSIFAAERKHYVTLFLVSSCLEGEPKPLEPEKCLGWNWFQEANLPKPLFAPFHTILAAGWKIPT